MNKKETTEDERSPVQTRTATKKNPQRRLSEENVTLARRIQKPKTTVSNEAETRRRKIAEEKAEADRQIEEIKKAEELHKSIQEEKKATQIKLERQQKLEIEAQQKEIKQEINKTKMNQQQIQQSIASFVPEFNGKDTDNELTRFLGTATSIYDSLTTDIERNIFNKLIKYRLTGDAYTRINNRQIEDFPTLKTLMNNMYSNTYSLEELEKNFTETRQSYGETIRNYGYRLSEALEKYKSGYKTKYNLNNLDITYSNHLDTKAVQTFKIGLNNTILKEKIATYRANNIDEIIDETETMEKLLLTTTNTPNTHQPPPVSQPHWPVQNVQQYTTQPKITTKINPIICNYCQKPNHTWDTCRTRFYAEAANQRRSQSRPYSFNQTPQYQPRNQYQGNRPQYNYRQDYNTQPQQNFQQNTQTYHPQNRYSAPQQYPNFSSQNQHTTDFRNKPIISTQPFNGQTQNGNNFTSRPPKYCSHCKTTSGHTYEECRSKFLTNRNQNQRNFNENGPQRQPGNESLEDSFNKLRINMIRPQQTNQIGTYEQEHQGNSNGSDQS